MRIGLVCQGFYPDAGGVESHTRGLARELISRGHEVLALALDYSGRHEPYAVTDTTVEGVRLRRMAYLYHDHRALADLVVNRRAEEVARRWAQELRPDVVHVHHATGFGLGVLRALREATGALVMTLHDYWPLCPRGQMMRADGGFCAVPEPETCARCLGATWPHLLPSGGGEERPPEGEGGSFTGTDRDAAAARTSFSLQALGVPDRLLTPSAAAKAVYVRAGIDPARIEVCENGIEVDGLVRAVAELRAREPERTGLRLGVLGTVLPSKGALELARAFLRADPKDCTLEVHGAMPPYHGDSSYVRALEELAATDERVHLHGAYGLDELPGILAGLDAVAAPSRWAEVYGLTVREARAAGLPVLVSDAGDLPAVTLEGRAGLVVPLGEGAEDVDAWVAAIRRFATDDAARSAWSRAASRPLTAGEMTDRIEAVYRTLVDGA